MKPLIYRADLRVPPSLCALAVIFVATACTEPVPSGGGQYHCSPSGFGQTSHCISN